MGEREGKKGVGRLKQIAVGVRKMPEVFLETIKALRELERVGLEDREWWLEKEELQ